MSKEVLECVNALLYDTLVDLIEPLSVADLHPASALAAGTGDAIDHKAAYKMILDKIQTPKHFVPTGLAATKVAHGPRGGLNGFRPGLNLPVKGEVSPVAFDLEEKKSGLVAMGERLDAVAEAAGFSATTASFVSDMNNAAAAVSVPPPASGGNIAQMGFCVPAGGDPPMVTVGAADVQPAGNIPSAGGARQVLIWLMRWARVRGGRAALGWWCSRGHHSLRDGNMGYDPKEKVKCPKFPRKIRRDGLSTHLKIHQKKERRAGSVETLFRRHADAQDEDVSRPTSPQSSMPQSSNISGGISDGIGMGTPVRSL
ncbi:hypothetical protein CYMTET_23374 [Cymbomonas tetramitiformis]|uniref:Uncharacterized protein n=1 Tax=Cymbomonas tetramitiformis TaxID=36881 RepID=A0AAE0FYK2_9CHLO|nr:hypothetical protein CYMTET_23374 [Cymbomonas tetramitiformis]